VGFLARPRSDSAAAAQESPATMLLGMGVAALTCLALAVAPQRLGPWLSRAVSTSFAVSSASPTGAPIVGDPVTLRLVGIASTLSPLVLAICIVAGIGVVAVAAGALRAGVRRRREVQLWSCGAYAPTARMQYTATSFAEPLQRVFDDVLAPQTDVDVTPHAESVYLLERVTYRRRIPDRIEHRLYQPVISTAARLRRLGPVLANGSVHQYLSYGLFGVAGLLLVLAVIR
jgi:hypothetical protein